MAKSGIHIAPSKKGTFTAAAKKHGKSVQGFASQVLANKENYSPAMVKKANFARNAAKWKKGENGLIINPAEAAVLAMSGVSALLPDDMGNPTPTVRPVTMSNPLAYGTGSGALMQDGGKIKYIDSVLNANKHLDWVKRLYKKNPKSVQIPGQEFPSTHFMESSDGKVYPTVAKYKGKLTYLPSVGVDPREYAEQTKTYIQFPDDEKASWFGENYKQGTNVLKKSKKMAEGGKVEGDEKASILKMNKRKVKPELYTPFGKSAQLAYDEGWYPISENRGQVTYGSEYGLLNSVDLGAGKPKGRMSLVGNQNGLFDIVIQDDGMKEVFKIAHQIPYTEVDKYFTKQKNIIDERQKQVMDQGIVKTNSIFKNGGKMKTAKNGMKLLDSNTVEFIGDKHSDPSGGIPMAAHGKQVLVEDDETAYVSPVDNSVNIMGNLKNPLTGNKYKKDSKMLAEKQAKVEKYIDAGVELVNNTKPMDKWDSLKFNSGEAMMKGGTFRKKQIVEAKEHLAEMQEAHLELVNPEAAQARWGMKLAENGTSLIDEKVPTLGDVKGNSIFSYNNEGLFANPEWGMGDDMEIQPIGKKTYAPINLPNPINKTAPSYSVNKRMNTEEFAPTNAEGLSFTQILPELYTAATNKEQGVFAQNFTPELFSPYSVSFQDRRNAATSQFRGASQFLRDNPAAQAQLAAQAYGQINEANAEEFRTNQGIFTDIVNKNTALLNEAKSRNLNIADNQYVRQQQAKANTRAQNRVILQSIADKIHQNKLEQETLKLYENMYNFRFDPATGKAINYNSTPDWEANVHGINTIPSETKEETITKIGNTTRRITNYPDSVTEGQRLANRKKKKEDKFIGPLPPQAILNRGVTK